MLHIPPTQQMHLPAGIVGNFNLKLWTHNVCKPHWTKYCKEMMNKFWIIYSVNVWKTEIIVAFLWQAIVSFKEKSQSFYNISDIVTTKLFQICLQFIYSNLAQANVACTTHAKSSSFKGCRAPLFKYSSSNLNQNFILHIINQGPMSTTSLYDSTNLQDCQNFHIPHVIGIMPDE